MLRRAGAERILRFRIEARRMMVLSFPDLAALGFFLAAWVSYSMAVRVGLMKREGLNHSMDQYRMRWMEEMARRDVRIVDANIMASLQNGAAFFTSLSFAPKGSPGDGDDASLQAWLSDLAGRTMELVAEVEASDFVVVLTAAGEDARAISIIADACHLHNKTLVGLVVPREGAGSEEGMAPTRRMPPRPPKSPTLDTRVKAAIMARGLGKR
jgi:hypothetical protein